MKWIRFLYPEYRTKMAESISEELNPLSLTVIVVRKGASGVILPP
jgi:hypothetical protein